MQINSKKVPPPLIRGQSSKSPKLSGLFEFNNKQKYDQMEDDYYDEDAEMYFNEQRGHNFQISDDPKQQNYMSNPEEDLMKLCKDHECLIGEYIHTLL